MKTLSVLLAFLFLIDVRADGTTPIDTEKLIQSWESFRPGIETIKETLDLGSDEELAKIVGEVNPEIIKKVEALNITLTPNQVKQLEKAAQDNKTSVAAALITGKVPEKLMTEAERIVPELKKLDQKTKQEFFKAAGQSVNRLVFDRMAQAELLTGYLAGDFQSYVIAQVNARFLNIRKVVIGGIVIEDVHVKLTAGFPQNGFTLLNGKVSAKGKDWSVEGELLGLSHDIAKEELEFTLARARLNYSILPWLESYTALGIGLKSATSTVPVLDVKAGLEAKAELGPLKARGFVEGIYKIAENSPVISCGGTLGIDVIDKDFLKMQTGILSQINIEPRAMGGNQIESINALGISGRF